MTQLVLYRLALPDFSWIPTGPRVKAASLAIGAVLLWATWPTLATYTQPAPTFMVFALAAAIGFAATFSRALWRGEARAFLNVRPRTLVFVATGLFANNVLYLFAMPRIGPAEANVIAYLWPVMLVAMGAWFGRSRLSMLQLVGILVAFVGAATVIGPRLDGGFDTLGLVLAFGSGLVFAVYALVRSFAEDIGDVIGPSMGLIAVMAGIAHFVFETPQALSLTQILAIVGIGLAPLSFSNILWDRASRTGQLPLISAIAYFTPLVSLLLLAVSGVAAVGLATALGALLIVVGALCAAQLFGGRH